MVCVCALGFEKPCLENHRDRRLDVVGLWTIANKNQPLSSGSWVFCYLQPEVFLVDVSAWKLNRFMWKTTLTYPRALWMKKAQLLSFLTGKEATPMLFPRVRQLMTWVNPQPGHWSGVLCLTVTLLDAHPLSPLQRAIAAPRTGLAILPLALSPGLYAAVPYLSHFVSLAFFFPIILLFGSCSPRASSWCVISFRVQGRVQDSVIPLTQGM